MAKTKDKKPELTLDDKGYFFEDMDEKQKGIYLHLKNVNDKINSNGFLGEQLEVTKGALITMFRDTLSEEKEEK